MTSKGKISQRRTQKQFQGGAKEKADKDEVQTGRASKKGREKCLKARTGDIRTSESTDLKAVNLYLEDGKIKRRKGTIYSIQGNRK